MGTILPDTSVSADHLGTKTEKQGYLEQKRAWQMDRGIQGNKTADILRFTESGGSAYAHVDPTYTQVPGLSGLNVYAEERPRVIESRFGGLYETGDILFIFYDVTGGIGRQDVIRFESQDYNVIEILDEPRSGRYEVLGRKARCTA